MKSLVVMTYYQLMHSIAIALTFEQKPKLFFCMEFLDPKEELLDRIRDTGVFDEVKGITRRGDFTALVKELRKTKDCSIEEIDALGSSLFEKYLEPHFADELKDADTEDEIYVYNDFQWHYYYICNHFKHIVGVEDGYCSLLQQIGVHVYRGDKERLEPFIERGYYPESLYRFKNVEKIISSTDFDELDDYYKSKLVVWDYKDIVALNEKKFKEALLYIFDVKGMGIKENSALYLGQPLDRSKYCSALDNYLLCKRIIRNEEQLGLNVYYKPHPAERNDPRVYGDENATVLSKDFPVEVFNYQDQMFERLVTFGSTGSSLFTGAKETFKYFDKVEFTRDDVKECIQELIKDEKLIVDFYIKVKEFSPESYLDVYSCIIRNRKIHTNLHILTINREMTEHAKEYFDKVHIRTRIKEYKADGRFSRESKLWHKELGWIRNWADRYEPDLLFHTVPSFDELTIFNEAISRNPKYDYFMILDSFNLGFRLTVEIQKALKARVFPAIFFPLHTSVLDARNKSIKISLKQGYIGSEYSGGMSNKLFHRELIRQFENGERSYQQLAEVIGSYDEYVRKNSGLSLYITPETYTDIVDGEGYYREKADSIIRKYQDKPEYLTGQLANVVYDYYNWYSVINANALAIQISDAVELLIDDEEQRNGVYRIIANAIVREKILTDNLSLLQESNYYQEIKSVVDIASEWGFLKGIDNIERIKDKLHIGCKS